MEILLIAAMLLYHIVNVYTDVKYRKTKNLWHLLFLIGGCAYYFLNGLSVMSFVLIIILTFAFGITMEVTKVTCPGDTKMLLVTAAWIGSLGKPAFISVFGLFLFFLSIIFIISVVVVVRAKGLKWTIANQIHNFKALIFRTPFYSEKVFSSFPGAVAISVGAFLQIAFLYYYVGGA